jgi:hypothetical protein
MKKIVCTTLDSFLNESHGNSLINYLYDFILRIAKNHFGVNTKIISFDKTVEEDFWEIGVDLSNDIHIQVTGSDIDEEDYAEYYEENLEVYVNSENNMKIPMEFTSDIEDLFKGIEISGYQLNEGKEFKRSLDPRR